jgi:hypothetical protein
MRNYLKEEHLAAYIDKGLTCKVRGSRKKYTVDGLRWGKAVLIDRSSVTYYKQLNEVLPCLRPLSQLTEVIEHNGERFVPIIELAKKHHVNPFNRVTHYIDPQCSDRFAMVKCCVNKSDSRYMYYQVFLDALRNNYEIVKHLHSLHFDTFGLLEAGLAEPIQSMPQP